jgi:integrase
VTAAVAEADPYVLPTPDPGSPVVLPKWISPANPHPVSRYQDLTWSLAPLVDNPSSNLYTIHWKDCPAQLRGPLRQAAWAMINGELRPTYLLARGVAARGRRSASTIGDTCREWMRLARWLHERGVTSLAACTGDDWREYAAGRIKDGVTRDHAVKNLGWLTDLWAFDQLTACPSGIARPPWETEGIDGYLPAATGAAGGENATEPLDPQVIGPLLVWAIRVTEDLSDDILAAWAENRRLTALAGSITGSPAGRAALEAYLLPLARSGSPLPAVRHRGKDMLARTFIAAVTGASPAQLDRFQVRHGSLTALAARQPGPCPLETPVTGQVNGRPWRQHLDFGEAPELMRQLGTAAAIICLYLTGMRPQEVQGLRSGCCPDPEPGPDGTARRHLIRSRHYKNVTDADGNHVSAGEDRGVPWVAIAPVVRAIRVLERIVPPGELLFSAAYHSFPVQHALHGALKNCTLNRRIEGFIAWANREAAVHGIPEQVIPADPLGPVGTSRFRRTLAWHVARRPGGLIALAIQYGHMRTVLDARTSSGYASRSVHGIHGVLDVETALAAADTAARLGDRLAAGEKVSGPAARRALAAVAEAPRFEGRLVTKNFTRQATAYLARDGLVLFDNPDGCLICVFKRDTALCEPGPGATAPSRHDCRPGCGNAVRTDGHAHALRERALRAEQLAAHAPAPVARRLRAAGARDRAAADAHDATAQPAGALA